MLSGGGRREFIWACRGWIAREQYGEGEKVTGESLNEAALLERVESLQKERDAAEQREAKLREALDRCIAVLCETRNHTGRRPCKFCLDTMALAESAQKKEAK